MKTLHKLSFILLSFTLTLSCGTDDDTPELTGSGTVKIEFDNKMAKQDLVLGHSNEANAQGEALTISRLNYTVGNFELIDTQGSVFTYPQNPAYITISEENEQTQVTLKHVPAGRYTALKFTLGVAPENQPQSLQAQDNPSTKISATQAAYPFLNFEGTFTTPSNTELTEFKIHMDSDDSGTYKEIYWRDFGGDQALVSDGMSPLIHLIVDADRILNGIRLAEESEDNTGKATITNSHTKAEDIVDNTSTMFEADHVHNGSGGHH